MSSSESGASSQAPTPSPDSTAPTSPAELTGRPEAEFVKGWRPAYHLMPRTGWMNDPCAPAYDPTTGLYRVSFQWNPNGPDWGDITWGTATSSDLIHWTVQEHPVLSPDAPYDQHGVWTGCSMPSRDGSLTYAYTSVDSLPIHHTMPHRRGCESLSLAKSFDNGKTWAKISANPVLAGEPEGLDVTGFRDPFCASWPAMSKFLGLDPENTLFGIISGGLRDQTPTVFLYQINPNDVTQWTYLGPLTRFGINTRLSRWSGDLGRNWEVTNFVTLRDEEDASITREFLIAGTEGCIYDEETSQEQRKWRPARGQLWMSGPLKAGNGGEASSPAELTYKFGGHLDRGCLYAANSFFDPKSQRQIVWGWITEEDLCDAMRHQQGWSGVLAMPRELFMQTLHNVVGASASDLSAITSIEAVEDGNGRFSVRTLASRPYLPLVKSLRQGPNARQYRLGRSKLGAPGSKEVRFFSDAVRTTRWELDCSFKVSKSTSAVGVRIDNSRDLSRATTLMFAPPTETFTVERPMLPTQKSSSLMNSAPEGAPHTLFTTCDPATGVADVEVLHIQAWQDNSVLEVFVNSRTVISTRLYGAKEVFGMTFFACEESSAGDCSIGDAGCSDGTTELIDAVVWDDIGIA